MRNPVVKCEFDGVTRDGREIVIHVAIGDAREFAKKYPRRDPGFFVEIEPLVGRKISVGTPTTSDIVSIWNILTMPFPLQR